MRNVAKFRENLTLQQFKVIDLGVNGKPIYTSNQSLIVTLAVSATVFMILTLKDRQERCAIVKMTVRCALCK